MAKSKTESFNSIKPRNKISMPLAAVVILALVGVGGYVVAGAHAGGTGAVAYVYPLSTPKNLKLVAPTCGAGASPGVMLSWSRPADFAKVAYYALLRNGKSVGTFSTDGAQTPAVTQTCFFGTFVTGDKLTIKSYATSNVSAAVTR